MRVAVPLLLCAFATACSGGSKGGGASGQYGGTFTLQNSASAPYAYGYFVSSAGEFTAPALDTCLVATTASQPAPRYLDAGATLTISGGPAPISLARTGDSSYLYYSAFPAASAIPADTSFDVTATGGPDLGAMSLPGVLAVRHAISLGANVAVPASADLALTWAPVGADFIRFDFFNGFSPPALLSCIAKDDGSFAIPAAILAALPAGAGNGLITSATVEKTRIVGGRVVVFDGVAEAETIWSK